MREPDHTAPEHGRGSAIGKLVGVFAVLIIAAALFAGGVLLANTGMLPSLDDIMGKKTQLTSQTVEEIIKPASDLVTSRYYYTDASTLESSKQLQDITLPFTTTKIIFKYDGVVSLGIDLSKVSFQIDDEAKTIEVDLPALNILANEIDENSFVYVYTESSVFNESDFSDFTPYLAQLKQQAAERVWENERFIEQAWTNTEGVLRAFLTSADATSDYSVTFTRAE